MPRYVVRTYRTEEIDYELEASSPEDAEGALPVGRRRDRQRHHRLRRLRGSGRGRVPHAPRAVTTREDIIMGETPEPLTDRVTRLAIQGIYQHGEYAKARPELRTGQEEVSEGGRVITFTVEPEDGSSDRVTVTVRRTR